MRFWITLGSQNDLQNHVKVLAYIDKTCPWTLPGTKIIPQATFEVSRGHFLTPKAHFLTPKAHFSTPKAEYCGPNIIQISNCRVHNYITSCFILTVHRPFNDRSCGDQQPPCTTYSNYDFRTLSHRPCQHTHSCQTCFALEKPVIQSRPINISIALAFAWLETLASLSILT